MLTVLLEISDKMRNLAGVADADRFIMVELETAQIPIVNVPRDRYSEVPYTIKGKLKDWNFERAWCYMMTGTPEGKGLTLEVANQLHFKKYPIDIEPKQTTYSCGPIKIYGQSVRVAGHCACPEPKELASPTVDVYHIDTQEGLNELARTIKSISKK